MVEVFKGLRWREIWRVYVASAIGYIGSCVGMFVETMLYPSSGWVDPGMFDFAMIAAPVSAGFALLITAIWVVYFLAASVFGSSRIARAYYALGGAVLTLALVLWINGLARVTYQGFTFVVFLPLFFSIIAMHWLWRGMRGQND